MKFLFFLLLIFLFMVFAMGFSVVRFIYRLFSGERSGKMNDSREQTKRQQRKTNYTGTKNDTPKVFAREEGEYVDFEEVKTSRE